MGGAVTAHLHIDSTSLVHRLPAHAKLLGLLALVLTVVAIPAGAWGPLAGAVILGAAVLAATRVPARHTLPRLLVDVPFVVFALALPFLARGEEIALGPLRLSAAGLVAGGTLLAKATTGALAGVAFAVTTRPQDLVLALQRLRVPDPLVLIVSFMVRYLSVVGDDLARMRVALVSRGFRPRSPAAWPVLAASAGALFIRTYERGERVHLAMVSRGYAGHLPAVEAPVTEPAHWATALLPTGCALLLLLWAVAP